MKNTQLKETAYKLASNELLRLVQENFGRVPRDEWADRVLNLRDSLEADTTPQPAQAVQQSEGPSINAKLRKSGQVGAALDREAVDAIWESASDPENAEMSIYKFAELIQAAVQLPSAASEQNPWKQAVLHQCMMVEGCYQESDPVASVKSLIDWHVSNERDSVNSLTNATPSRYALKDQIMQTEFADSQGWAGRDISEFATISAPSAAQPLTCIWTEQVDNIPKASPKPPSAPMQPLTCSWTEQDDDAMPDTYESDCGKTWSFIVGGVKENNICFCHGCGKPIEIQNIPKAAPQPSSAAIQPLTDEQIEKVWAAHKANGDCPFPGGVTYANRFNLVRAIEAAHGITKATP